MKKFMAVVGLLVMAGLGAFALTASNYWIYWVSGDTVIAGITASGRLDTLAGATFGGNISLSGTLTVGEDDTGYDITFYGATAGAALQWDESDDQLELVGSANISHASATNAGPVFVSVNTVAYTDSTAKDLFVLPADADIVDVVVIVDTAFDDSGTDLLNVGWSADPDALVDDHNVASAGVSRMGSGATMPYANIGDVGSSDLTITGSYTGQNGDASAGSATIYIYWTTGTPGS